ncbi:MAG: hypothetical protein P8Z00_12055 [Anaerolineales bacterium]
MTNSSVDSYARMMAGWSTKARAMAGRCCYPPDVSSGWWFVRFTRLTTLRQRRDCLIWARSPAPDSLNISSKFSGEDIPNFDTL